MAFEKRERSRAGVRGGKMQRVLEEEKARAENKFKRRC